MPHVPPTRRRALSVLVAALALLAVGGCGGEQGEAARRGDEEPGHARHLRTREAATQVGADRTLRWPTLPYS